MQGGLSLDFYNFDAHNAAPYPELKNNSNIFALRDTIVIQEELNTVKRQGISAITGVGTEIYFKGKPIFEITLFYNQGLRNLIASDVRFQVNSLSGHTRLITRGSSFGTTLAVPIRLKTFKAKADS